MQATGTVEALDVLEQIPAGLVEQLQRLGGPATIEAGDLRTLLRRVELRSLETHLLLNVEAMFKDEHPELALSAVRDRLVSAEHAVRERDAPDTIRVVLRCRMQLRGGRAALFGASDSRSGKIDPLLVTALKRAHINLVASTASPFTPSETLQDGAAPARELCAPVELS